MLLAHGYLPDKVDLLFPSAKSNMWLFSDGTDNEGGSHANWLDREENAFECNVTHAIAWPYCGTEIQLTPDFQGVDISEYKAMKVYINYAGPSTQVGVTLRSFEPASFVEGNVDSLKSSIVSIDTFELVGADTPIIIKPAEWQVLPWWLDRYTIARESRYTDFSHVVVVGLNLDDKPVDGKHRMQLKKVEVVKNLISEKTWYVVLISVWLLCVFLLVSWSLIKLLRQSKQHSSKAEALSIYADELSLLSEYHKNEAMRDELTGLYNRKGLAEYLKTKLEKDEAFNLSLILFDLDFFKKVNDSYGHDAGDQVLVSIAATINVNIRQSDCFCRWGGEEFAILCPAMPIEKTSEFANSLCNLIASTQIKTSSTMINITASFGVSAGHVDQNNLIDALFERADSALYKAKGNGRNRVELS